MAKRIARKAAPKKPAKRRTRKPAPIAELRYIAGRLIDGEDALAEATAALLALDQATIAHLVEIGGPPPLRRREPGFAGLAAIIVSQQVSVASAAAIFDRLEAALTPLSAATVLAAEEAALRGVGLSSPKIRAITAAARAVAHDGLDLAALAALPAADAHRALVAVKGIGPWTADIFLLFCVGHPDAFPAGDLALQEAARLALAHKKRPTHRELEKIAERWRPYRGVAARMLWAYYRVVKARAGVVDLGGDAKGGLDEPKPKKPRAHDRQTDRTAPGGQERPRKTARRVPARVRGRRK
jgi:DNA-3-methyladenine glycosylase II